MSTSFGHFSRTEGTDEPAPLGSTAATASRHGKPGEQRKPAEVIDRQARSRRDAGPQQNGRRQRLPGRRNPDAPESSPPRGLAAGGDHRELRTVGGDRQKIVVGRGCFRDDTKVGEGSAAREVHRVHTP
jgi:hypothetical protein